jgi:hypothetical protein
VTVTAKLSTSLVACSCSSAPTTRRSSMAQIVTAALEIDKPQHREDSCLSTHYSLRGNSWYLKWHVLALRLQASLPGLPLSPLGSVPLRESQSTSRFF